MWFLWTCSFGIFKKDTYGPSRIGSLLVYAVRYDMIKVRLPWFRVHIVILNDPGRLISVHIMHTGLAAGWAGCMVLYELIIVDATDPVYNPVWRQGSYVIPFMCRLGVCRSLYSWGLGIKLSINLYWTYETVDIGHITLSGFCVLAGFWHWSYWDLDLFVSSRTGQLVLDLNKILGIHLCLASIACFGFGLGHLCGFYGPGIWTSDSLGVLGSIRLIKPIYSVIGLAPFCYGVISSNHIVAGLLGIWIGLWHMSTRPGKAIYKLLNMGNLEEVLCSSIAAVLFIALLISGAMWYGSLSAATELFGPSRYQWDNGYFCVDIERRVKSAGSKQAISSLFASLFASFQSFQASFQSFASSFASFHQASQASSQAFYNTIAWEQVPDKLVLYDYIGCNPSKGGLFRSGPILKGDGFMQTWCGHGVFEIGTLSLAVRRMPGFFETFPCILIDQGGTVRADIPFRRAESRYSIEETNVVIYFAGGILNGTEYSRPSLVKDYARKAQFGEIFIFDKKTASADGVFRSSARGWYSFSHTALGFIFFFGHLWHSSRAVLQDLWAGLWVTAESLDQVEYGRNEKLRD